MDEVVHGPGLLTEQDIWLFKQGNHFRLYDKLGAHMGNPGLSRIAPACLQADGDCPGISGSVAGGLVWMVLDSRARLVILPLQDVLGLGQEARMNRPATSEGNWQWRVSRSALNMRHTRWLAGLTASSGRCRRSVP